jgi:hypothetical protein
VAACFASWAMQFSEAVWPAMRVASMHSKWSAILVISQ